MQARHLKISEHSQLYNSIHKEIKESLSIDKKQSNRYFLLKLFIYGGLSLTSYSLFYIIENPVWFILDYIVFGFSAVLLCFNFAHDLSHNAIFKNAFLNNFFFEFIYTLVGAHPEAWKDRHEHSHHFAPNVKNFDTDMAITGIIRVLPDSELRWYHKYQHLYAGIAYTTYSFYWVFIKDFIVLFKNTKKNASFKYIFRFIVQKCFYISYLLILPLIFSHQNPLIILIAFLAMHMVQSIYTLFTFFITHHVSGSVYPKSDENGIINTSWFMNQIKSSNDFYPFSRLANFIFGGVNNHIAHHLFPHINHYYYPQLNRILFKRLTEQGIEPNVTSYFGGVRSHLLLLKRMGNA